MRHLPTDTYKGLTIVLSNPSRFDVKNKSLLSANAGFYFKTEFLPHKGIGIENCDIRTADTLREGLLGATKGILLLGHTAFQQWTGGVRYKDYSISEQRGNPLEHKFGNDISVITSYSLQDCFDIKDYESTGNPLLNGEDESGDYSLPENDEDDEADDAKKHGKTKRSNWRFWLQRDVRKLVEKIVMPDKWAPLNDPKPIIYPSLESVITILRQTKGSLLYLDIECHPETRTLWCIGLCFDTGPAFVVPIFRHNLSLAYSNTASLLASLAIAMRDNTVVTHNGFTFDLILLAWRYHIPFGRNNYDTMLAMQRCFPEVEKSLGHGISCWLWEHYHKDEGIFNLHNAEQETKLWHYNAKDVYTMRGIKKAIDTYGKVIPGLDDSIRVACLAIYSYALNTLVGIPVDDELISSTIKDNDRKMTQILRMCRLLLGKDFLPTSNSDVPKYLHDEMGYKVMARTKKGQPSCGELAIQKLKLAYSDNPMLDLILKFRAISKETGALKFNKWDFENPLKVIE